MPGGRRNWRWRGSTNTMPLCGSRIRTTDVQRRLDVHNSGKGSAYVRAHRSAKLVAFTESINRSATASLEYSVKALNRSKKFALAKKWKCGQRGE